MYMYDQQSHPGYDQPSTSASGVSEHWQVPDSSIDSKLQPPPANAYQIGEPIASQVLPVSSTYPQTSAYSPGYGYDQGESELRVQAVQAPPFDCFGCSIFAMLCCCWCLGLAALLKSIESREAVARGDMAAAVKHSKSAGRLVIWSVVCGIVLGVTAVVLYVVLVKNASNHA